MKLSEKRVFVVETKWLEDVKVALKMRRLRQRCADLNRVQGDVLCGLVYVDRKSFEKYKPSSFRQLMEGFRNYQE